MMKQYDSYKDSGVEWIGKIPSHWEVCAFKRKIVINNGRDYKEYLDDEIYPVMGSGGCFTYCSKYLYDGEAVLLGRKGTVDKPLYINGKFWAVDTMFYATPLSGLHCKFAYYLALTFPFDYYSTSTALPSMTQSDLGNNPVALPPFDEQKQIAQYLDKKCGEIDKAISTQEKRVELLKELKQNVITQAVTRGINPDAPLKDSGVEWIGEVPKHWDVRKLKNICKSEKYAIKTGPFGSQLKGEELQPDGDVRVYSQRNVIDNNFEDTNFYVSNAKAKDLESFYTQPLDLLVTSRGTIGKCAILPADAPMGILHPCLIAMRVDTNICDIKFVQIYMNESICFGTNVYLNSNATTIEVIYTDTLKNISIPVPPLSEQKEIVSYIETKTASIDKSIEKAEHQIELLQELKQSIITEVVTGKRKVC